MKISNETYQELRRLVRAANRRIERATPGQQKALEYYVKKATGDTKWSSAAAGMSTQQASARIQQLRKFMGYDEQNRQVEQVTSTRTGWEAIKANNVAKANATFGRRRAGHNLTDEEMAEILIQIGDQGKHEFYHAVNKVQAMKGYMGDKWSGDKDDIAKALSMKWSAQDAYRRALDVRKMNVSNKARENEGADIPF